MDPLTVTTTCISLISTIGKTSFAVTKFVKDVRAARSDLDAVSRDLLSLTTVLELLAGDVKDSSAGTFPQALKKQIAGIVTNCSGVVVQIEEILNKHEGNQISKAAQWVTFGRSDVAKLQLSLEAHKSALELALDMVTLTLAKDIKADTQEILEDTSAIKQDTAQILAEIARLQQQLPQDADRNNASRFMLEKYLDGLTSYAETVYDNFTDDFDQYKSDDAGSISQEQSPTPISSPPRTETSTEIESGPELITSNQSEQSIQTVSGNFDVNEQALSGSGFNIPLLNLGTSRTGVQNLSGNVSCEDAFESASKVSSRVSSELPLRSSITTRQSIGGPLKESTTSLKPLISARASEESVTLVEREQKLHESPSAQAPIHSPIAHCQTRAEHQLRPVKAQKTTLGGEGEPRSPFRKLGATIEPNNSPKSEKLVENLAEPIHSTKETLALSSFGKPQAQHLTQQDVDRAQKIEANIRSKRKISNGNQYLSLGYSKKSKAVIRGELSRILNRLNFAVSGNGSDWVIHCGGPHSGFKFCIEKISLGFWQKEYVLFLICHKEDGLQFINPLVKFIAAFEKVPEVFEVGSFKVY